MVNGAIYIKILQVPHNNHNKLFHVEKLKKAELIKGSTAQKPHSNNNHSVHKEPNKGNSSSSTLQNGGSNTHPKPAPPVGGAAYRPPSTTPKPNEDLFSLGSIPTTDTQAPPPKNVHSPVQ